MGALAVFCRLLLPTVILSLCLFSWMGDGYAAEPVEYIEKKTLALQEILQLPIQWYVTAYQAKSTDQLGDDPARLCFWKQQDRRDESCFWEEDKIREDFILRYQFVNRLEIVALTARPKPRAGVLFVAKFSGGGSGWSRGISIWVPRKDVKRFQNILPKVRVSEQGEYRLFPSLRDNREGIFVVADYIGGEGETHFAPHKYKITMYALKKGAFKSAGQYITENKYPKCKDCEVDVESPNVIEPELTNIEKYLSRVKR